MPAFAAVTLKDHADANVVLTPSRIDANGVALWRDNSASIADAAWTLTESVRLPTKNGSVTRIQFKVVIPIMNGTVTTQKDGEIIANLEFVMPKVSVINSRADARKMLLALLADTICVNACAYLESVY